MINVDLTNDVEVKNSAVSGLLGYNKKFYENYFSNVVDKDRNVLNLSDVSGNLTRSCI